MLVFALTAIPLLLGIYLGATRRIRLETSAAIVGLGLMLLTGEQVYARGLETILLFPLAVPLLLALETRRDRVLAASLCWCVFVRLDALLLIPAFCVSAWFSSRRRGTRWGALGVRCLRVCGPACALAAIYLLVNARLLGIPVTLNELARVLAGPASRDWPSVLGELDELERTLPFAVALCLLEWTVRKLAVEVSAFGIDSLRVFALGCALQVAFYRAFAAAPPWPWYSYCYGLVLLPITCRIFLLTRGLWVAGHVRIAGTALVGVLGLTLGGAALALSQ
jgi:hypothetical protein